MIDALGNEAKPGQIITYSTSRDAFYYARIVTTTELFATVRKLVPTSVPRFLKETPATYRLVSTDFLILPDDSALVEELL